MTTLAVLFWLSLALVAYSYAGYPLLLAGLSRWRGRDPQPPRDPSAPGDWPMVSLIIAAYREEKIILQRIHNALLLDYPADRLEILIGCDGDLDGTGELVRSVSDPRVKLLQFPQRRGKPAVLNDCVAAAQGEVLTFSDANTFWRPEALKQLVRHFRDPSVGGVCGQLLITDPVTGDNADGVYWNYENFLKRHEGRLGALLGCNGAIYALRPWLYQPIPSGTIVDDFLIGMRVHLRGKRLLFEERAIADEESAPSQKAEFQRRARMGAGGFQSLCWLAPLLRPRYGVVALAFWSHKVLRWCCPLFLLTALLANIPLALQSPFYVALLAAQGAFYSLALLGRLSGGRGLPARLARVTSLFVGMNAALAVGFWKWATNRQSGAWQRTVRSVELPRTTSEREALAQR